MNQRLIERIFAKMGYRIDIVENGLQAVERASAQQYDLILMDIQMPEMDGIEASERILIDTRARGTVEPTIIAVTANASQENLKRCMDAGMRDFVPKPFTLERLGEIVERWGSTGASPSHPAP